MIFNSVFLNVKFLNIIFVSIIYELSVEFKIRKREVRYRGTTDEVTTRPNELKTPETRVLRLNTSLGSRPVVDSPPLPPEH